MKKLCLLAVVAVALAAAGSSAQAADTSWTGATSGDMATTTNWSAGLAKDGTDNLKITDVSYTVLPASMSAALNIADMTFNTNYTGNVTIASTSALTISGAGGITKDNAGTVALNLPVTLGASQTWTNNGAGLLTLGGAVGLGANTLTVAGAGNTTISGALGGGGAGGTVLTKTGAGTLTLTATNSFAGDVLISGGVLSVTADGQLGTAASSHTYTIDGSGATFRWAQTGTGDAPLGATRFLSVGAGGGTIEVVTKDRNLVLGTAGQLAGSGDLAKTGAGRLYLNQANAGFTGSVRIVQGILSLGHADALQNASALTTIAALAPAKTEFTGLASDLVSGELRLNPALVYSGPSYTRDNGAVGWTADITLAALPGPYSANTILSTLAGSPGTGTKLLHLGGSASAGTMFGQFTIDDDGLLPVALVKSGTSTLDLTHAANQTNSYTGGTAIQGGTVKVTDGTELSSGAVMFAAKDVTLQFTTDGKVGGLNNTLKICGGNGEQAYVSVPTTKTVQFNNNPDATAGVLSVTVTGGGTLVFQTAAINTVSAATRFGLGVSGGSTLIFDQLPGSTDDAKTTGDLIANGGKIVFTNTGPAQYHAGGGSLADDQGFRKLNSIAGTTTEIEVQGTSTPTGGDYSTIRELRVPSRGGSPIAGTINKTGGGALWLIAGSSNATLSGTGTINVQEGRLRVGSSMPGVGSPNQAAYSGTGLTIRVYSGAMWQSTGVGSVGPYFAGFVCNDTDASDAVNPIISDVLFRSTTGATTSGPITWGGTLETRGTIEFNRAADAGAGTITVAAGSKLLIPSGVTVKAMNTLDPFTDTADPTKHVAIENNGTLNVSGGVKAAGAVSGTGTVTVAAGATLAADTFVQPTVTLTGAVLNPVALLLRDQAGMSMSSINTLAIAGTTPEAEIGVGDNMTLTIATAFTAPAGTQLTKSGLGVLTVNAPQTYGTGSSLTVSGGTMNINTNAGIPATGGTPAGARLALSLTGGNVVLGATQDLAGLARTAGTLDLMDHLVRLYTASPAATEVAVRGILNAAGILDTLKAGDERVGYTDQRTDAYGTQYVAIRTVYAGDANMDGRVSFSDFSDLLGNYGSSGKTWDLGDYNYDGLVSFSDFSDLLGNYGKTGGNHVPEPATLALMVLGGLGLLARRRR